MDEKLKNVIRKHKKGITLFAKRNPEKAYPVLTMFVNEDATKPVYGCIAAIDDGTKLSHHLRILADWLDKNPDKLTTEYIT